MASSLDSYSPCTAYVLPSETDSITLQEERYYTFTISENGSERVDDDYMLETESYKEFLNGNTTPPFEGGEFLLSDEKEFCVPSSDTPTTPHTTGDDAIVDD